MCNLLLVGNGKSISKYQKKVKKEVSKISSNCTGKVTVKKENTSCELRVQTYELRVQIHVL